MKTQKSTIPNVSSNYRHQARMHPARVGRPQSSKGGRPRAPWCRRHGHNRICLTCGKNIKYRPNRCSNWKHRKAFNKRRRYNRAYWRKNMNRLMRCNRRYRTSHPGARNWQRDYSRRWYVQNRVRKLRQNRVWERRNAKWRRNYLRRKALHWYHSHRARARANCRRYYRLNKSRKNSRRNLLLKAARRRDPGLRIRYNLRMRLATLLRRGGVKRFSISGQVLLYTGDELRAHIEKQFSPLMTWSNYAIYWEIDHSRPCADFDLTDLVQARKCFALPNLRPLPLKINRGRYNATQAGTRRIHSRILKLLSPQPPKMPRDRRP
jgi:hypothetical protein